MREQMLLLLYYREEEEEEEERREVKEIVRDEDKGFVPSEVSL